MNIWQMIMLVGAGILGGMANAMAGGASLFTFPAMLAAGLPPVIANATNSFALLPGNSIGAYADRERIPPRNRAMATALALAIFGGLCGAALLLATSTRIFALLIPALIGAATLIFTFSTAIRKFLTRQLSGHEHPKLRLVMVMAAAIYNGFFGAGVGVIFLASLMATGHEDLRAANAFKNLLAFLSNIGGIVIFLMAGSISWPQGFVMMAGTTAGGLLGGTLMKILPTAVVRWVITICGTVMTAIYVYRFWL